jgi:hypothetical protein
MNKQDLLKLVDHTLLSATATEADIRTVCDDGIKYGCATICIPGTHVKYASEYAENRIKICAVTGFPHGCNITDVKCFEAEKAIRNGASDVDISYCYIFKILFDWFRCFCSFEYDRIKIINIVIYKGFLTDSFVLNSIKEFDYTLPNNSYTRRIHA